MLIEGLVRVFRPLRIDYSCMEESRCRREKGGDPVGEIHAGPPVAVTCSPLDYQLRQPFLPLLLFYNYCIAFFFPKISQQQQQQPGQNRQMNSSGSGSSTSSGFIFPQSWREKGTRFCSHLDMHFWFPSSSSSFPVFDICQRHQRFECRFLLGLACCGHSA